MIVQIVRKVGDVKQTLVFMSLASGLVAQQLERLSVRDSLSDTVTTIASEFFIWLTFLLLTWCFVAAFRAKRCSFHDRIVGRDRLPSARTELKGEDPIAPTTTEDRNVR
jgi:hypothetical protein